MMRKSGRKKVSRHTAHRFVEPSALHGAASVFDFFGPSYSRSNFRVDAISSQNPADGVAEDLVSVLHDWLAVEKDMRDHPDMRRALGMADG